MKPDSIKFKTTPQIKMILERLAKEGFRSLLSQVEMIVAKFLEDQRIDWYKEDSELESEKKIIRLMCLIVP